MKANLIKGLLVAISMTVATTAHARVRHTNTDSSNNYNSGGVHGGSTCTAGDRDPIKCKVCAIYGEDHGSTQGMYAVAGVIETRVHAGNWGNACNVVHAKGQFIGAWHVLPNNPKLIAEMVQAAEGASANGYMGFRSYCKPGRSRRIGGNCYGSADAEKFIVLDPTMTAEDVDSQAIENLQFAQTPDGDDAG